MSFEFSIHPRGPFSLEAAATFGFGPNEGRAAAWQGSMSLAFPVDSGGSAGVLLTADGDGVIRGAGDGSADPGAVERQVARILSLDHDAEEWMRVGLREPILGSLQAAHPGQRPVLFNSPYEACAWSVISARRHGRQGAALRREIADRWGESFELAGQRVAAFPAPERLLELRPLGGLPERKVTQLQAIARAALEGRLDADRLLRLGPDGALAEVRSLNGIGPFYGGLVVLRGTGFADAVFDVPEPRVLGRVAEFYGLEAPPTLAQFLAMAERWRPFRTWATVLLRLAGDRGDGAAWPRAAPE
ncbi:MAG: DNA-3-methyladenine glycosylase family protein [Solirubrobacteraceae bacterium]